MAQIEDIKKVWLQGCRTHQANTAMVSKSDFIDAIRTRIRKENKIMFEYIVAIGVWHMIIYAVMTHLVVRYWGNWHIMAYALAGIVMYIPHTVVFMKRIGGKNLRAIAPVQGAVSDIKSNLKNHYQQLSAFFRFKKKFDFIGIPLTCFIMVMLLSNLMIIPAIEKQLGVAVIFFVVYLTLFITATIVDNRKRFIQPLKQLEIVLKEMDEI
jgi:hypothetical protein